MKQKYLTPKQFCEMMHISYSSFKRWVKDKRIKVIDIGGGKNKIYRISPSEVERFTRISAALAGNLNK